MVRILVFHWPECKNILKKVLKLSNSSKGNAGYKDFSINKKVRESIEEFKAKISNSGSETDLKSIYFRDSLGELSEHIDYLNEKFNEIFN